MPIGYPSLRVDVDNDTHHLWCNNGTWWIHYTIHFGHRARRIRKSLRTRSLEEACARRDARLAAVAADGEVVPERRPCARGICPGSKSPPAAVNSPSLVSASAL